MTSISPSIRMMNFAEAQERRLYHGGLILDHEGKSYVLHAGSKDKVHVFTRSIYIFVLTINTALGYMGLDAYMPNEMGAIFGKSKTSISESISLLRLAEEIKDVCRGNQAIPKSVLNDIALLPTEEEMIKAFNAYSDKGLTGEDIRKMRGNQSRGSRGVGTKLLANIGERISTLEVDQMSGTQREKIKSVLENLYDIIRKLFEKLDS